MQTSTDKEDTDDKDQSEQKNKAAKASWWKQQISASKEAAKDSLRSTEDSYNEYLAGAKKKVVGSAGGAGSVAARETGMASASRFPAWWSSIRTVQPALYSRTPVMIANKQFDDLADNIARLGSLCLERLAKYNITCNPFDRVQYVTRDCYIHGGKATERVLIESKFKTEMVKTYYQAVPVVGPDGMQTMVYVSETGEQLMDGELLQDEQGFYQETENESLDSAHVSFEPVHYRDILHTPNARTWEEIDWVAFKAMMTHRDAVDRFGEEKASLLTYSDVKLGNSDKEKLTDVVTVPNKYATIWEIWDKRDKVVRWWSDGYLGTDGFLDEQEDPYELVGFFPCAPFMLGTIGPDDLYAVPDYVQLRPFIDQMHGLFGRVRVLLRSTRRRGLFDESVPELKQLAEFANEAEFIGVKNFRDLVGERGIENLVKFFPTKELAEAVVELMGAFENFEQKFYELYGIPDILRGVSDPRETAAAQQLKGKFLSLRFSAVQREFQRLIRDAIELSCDLALKKLPDEILAEIMGYAQMKPEDQQAFPEVLMLLKNDKQRKLRIDIETDSTITMNENAEIEQRNYLAKTLFDGLSAIGGLTQTNPAYAPIVGQTILYVIRGLRNGKEVEQALEQTLEQMTQAQAQPQQPNPEQMKMEAEAQFKQQEMGMKQQQMQLDAQMLQAKLAMQQQEIQLKAQGLQVQLQKIAAETQNEQMRIILDKEIADLDAFLKSSQMELEKQYLGLDMQERYMTEQRLQEEAKQKKTEQTVQAISQVAESSKKESPSVVNINVPQGGGLLGL